MSKLRNTNNELVASPFPLIFLMIIYKNSRYSFLRFRIFQFLKICISAWCVLIFIQSQNAVQAKSFDKKDENIDFENFLDEDTSESALESPRFYQSIIDNYWTSLSGPLSQQGEWESILVLFDQTQTSETKGIISVIINSIDPLTKVIINDKEIDAEGLFLVEYQFNYDLDIDGQKITVYTLTENGSRLDEFEPVDPRLNIGQPTQFLGFIELKYRYFSKEQPQQLLEKDRKNVQQIGEINLGFRFNFSRLIREKYFLPDSVLYIFSYHLSEENDSQENSYMLMNHLLNFEKKFNDVFSGNLITGINLNYRNIDTQRIENASTSLENKINENRSAFTYGAYFDYSIITGESKYGISYEAAFAKYSYDGEVFTENFLFFEDQTSYIHTLSAKYNYVFSYNYELIVILENKKYLTTGIFQRRDERQGILQLNQKVTGGSLEYKLKYKNTQYNEFNTTFGEDIVSNRFSVGASYYHFFSGSFLKFFSEYSDEDQNVDIRDKRILLLGVSYFYPF